MPNLRLAQVHYIDRIIQRSQPILAYEAQGRAMTDAQIDAELEAFVRRNRIDVDILTGRARLTDPETSHTAVENVNEANRTPTRIPQNVYLAYRLMRRNPPSPDRLQATSGDLYEPLMCELLGLPFNFRTGQRYRGPKGRMKHTPIIKVIGYHLNNEENPQHCEIVALWNHPLPEMDVRREFPR